MTVLFFGKPICVRNLTAEDRFRTEQIGYVDIQYRQLRSRPLSAFIYLHLLSSGERIFAEVFSQWGDRIIIDSLAPKSGLTKLSQPGCASNTLRVRKCWSNGFLAR